LQADLEEAEKNIEKLSLDLKELDVEFLEI
jgi:hypothetical protein